MPRRASARRSARPSGMATGVRSRSGRVDLGDRAPVRPVPAPVHVPLGVARVPARRSRRCPRAHRAARWTRRRGARPRDVPSRRGSGRRRPADRPRPRLPGGASSGGEPADRAAAADRARQQVAEALVVVVVLRELDQLGERLGPGVAGPAGASASEAVDRSAAASSVGRRSCRTRSGGSSIVRRLRASARASRRRRRARPASRRR